eukprot:SAG11_NODE_14718_length_602_cov_1.027833_1_plen_35_part_10
MQRAINNGATESVLLSSKENAEHIFQVLSIMMDLP